MQITLNHREIEQAIVEFIGNQGISVDNRKTSVSMVAGRGTRGYSATVVILPDLVENAVSDSEETTDPATIEFEETTNDAEEAAGSLFDA